MLSWVLGAEADSEILTGRPVNDPDGANAEAPTRSNKKENTFIMVNICSK